MNLEEKLVKNLHDNETVVQIIPLDELKSEAEYLHGKQSGMTNNSFLSTQPVQCGAAPAHNVYQTNHAIKDGLKSLAGFASPASDSKIAIQLLKEFGVNPSQLYIKQYGGKSYVVFKGYPGMRAFFKGTRYLTDNPKIVRMAIGPKGLKSAMKSGFVLTVILSVGIEVFNYFIKDEATLSELLGTITVDIVKFGLSAIAATVTGLAVGSLAIIGSIAAVPLIAAISMGLLTSYILDKVDERTGVTKALIKAYENLGLKLKEIKLEVEEIERKSNRWLQYFEDHPWEIQRLFGGQSYPPIRFYD